MLCKTLLQKEQISLFDRALSSKKPKEHVISPCLRLLTEILSFDGGSAAKSIYLYRDVTFKQLSIFLGMRKDSGGNLDDRKPSVRNNALRYLFANLRLQDQSAKAEILAQGRIFRAVFQDIREDSPSVIGGIFDTLKKEVIEDESIPRLSKARLFTDWTLGRLATLYGYHEDDRNPDGLTNVEEMVHEFLLLLCTNADYGVLVLEHDLRTDASKLDLEAADQFDTLLNSEAYSKRKPIRNRMLAAFLQSLRPYANMLQHDLAIAIFQAAPELIADYFHKKKTFSFEPKLTATWVGYSMLVMSTINLPIPKQYLQLETNGSLISFPVSAVMENILPQPLTQKVLTRCLNQNADLITFFAVRILIVAFEKLEKALKVLKSSHHEHQNRSEGRGDQAASRLIAAFCQQCPDMKHAIAVFRSRTRENVMLREAVTRLLTLYYTIVPQLALENKFDISIALSVALQGHNPGARGSNAPGVQSLELDHLLYIARCSPDMDWWHKTGISLCAFE